jgi:predicted DNA-binding protein (MmcQ/YjbR family)
VTKAAKLRDRIRDFALGFPGAHEDFPWGERVVKVNKKVFVFLGTDGADGAKEDEQPGITVKLTESHGHALSIPGAQPTAYGLGKAGWVSIPLGSAGVKYDLICDWVDESYRKVAPKRLVAELDERAKAP